MSKIKNGGLHQYGAEPFKQQQFGTAGVEGVNSHCLHCTCSVHDSRPIKLGLARACRLSALPIRGMGYRWEA